MSSELELLAILPGDQMADLLAAELEKLGFERDGNTVARVEGDITVSVDLDEGTVTVQAEQRTDVNVQGTKAGYAMEDEGPSSQAVRDKLKQDLKRELQRDVNEKEHELQQQVTDILEAKLSDIRRELDGAVNRATAAALKQKAAQIGQIKELTEDPDSGSLTIVVEV